ncbi:Sporulation initiation inhibitor protein Soj [subsurface metagenome]
MIRITIINQKGGTGKTTASVNIAYYLAKRGKKILLVDLDPQCNATLSLGIDPGKLNGSIYNVLGGSSTITEIYQSTNLPKLTIAPASEDLRDVDLVLGRAKDRWSLLKNALKPVNKSFDIAILDCPPALNLIVLNALVCSDYALISTVPSYLALEGIRAVLDTIEKVKRDFNPNLKIIGILPNLVDRRLRISKDSVDLLRSKFKDLIFKNVVHNCVRLNEAPGFSQTIFEYAPHSQGAKDYQKVSEELLRRLKQ